MDIRKVYDIDARPREVWAALTEPSVIERWGGGPVVMSPVPGSEFSLWGGDIHGTVADVDLGISMTQEWYGGDWDAPSFARFTLSTRPDGLTRLTLEHTGVPDDEAADFDAGWDEYYLRPIKELLEERAVEDVTSPSKIDIGTQGFVYPMPVTLIGSDRGDAPSFMTVAWVNRVQFNPPRVAMGINKNHATNEGIREHGEFSVCFPDESMVEVVDWCGLNSGARGADKAAQFEVFRGNLAHAPLIAECPLCLECTVFEVHDLGSHELFVGDVVGTWTEERFLDDGKPDLARMRPFTLTMPDNRFWAMGAEIGKAWSAGRGYVPKG